MMIIVTGAAGFIGSNLMSGLNNIGRTDIIAVDDLTDGHKFQNLAAAKFADYVHYEDLLDKLQTGDINPAAVDAIFHQGACSTTTEWNGRYMMQINYEYSKDLLHIAAQYQIPFIYASSAAVYGTDTKFSDLAATQTPLNVYGYSKWLFDQYVLQKLPKINSPVIGLRYFNVYGPREAHKGGMASVAYHWMQQLQQTDSIKLFAGYDGYADGEQLRDFVYVDDVVKLNLWLWQKKIPAGIFNCGTGCARSFNDLAKTLIQLHGSGKIQYIPFPDKLRGAYQSYTCADLTNLASTGYDLPWTTLEDGLAAYYTWMHKDLACVINE